MEELLERPLAMKIYNLESVLSSLKGKHLFLDNTALILLVNYIEIFSDFLIKLKEVNCELLTIPSVAFEFQRTDNIEAFNKRTTFLKTYVTTYSIERHLQEMEDLVPVIHRIKGNISYPDFLLYCCLYKFEGSMLLTENHRDFTTNILDRVNIFTVDAENANLRNTGLYQFDKSKYEKVVSSILSL